MTTSTNVTDPGGNNFTDTPDDGCYGVAWNISIINDVTLNLIGLDSFDLSHWESPALASGCIGAAVASGTGTATATVAPTTISLLAPPTGISTASAPTGTPVATGGGSCDSVTCPDSDSQTCNNGAELFTVSCEVVYSSEQLANLNFETLGECIAACATTYAGVCHGVSFFGWAYVDPNSPEFEWEDFEANCFPFAVASNPAVGENANGGWSAVITSVSKRDEPKARPHRFRRDTNSTSTNTTAPSVTPSVLSTVTIADSTGSLLLQPGIDGNLFVSVADSTTDISPLTDGVSFMADYTNNIIYGDTSDRLLYYYPAEMSTVAASRLRLGAWGSIPLGAQLIEFAPLTVGRTNMLVAFDTLGNHYWPFMCGLEGALNKIFLVADATKGAALLESADLQFTITGGIVESCGPLALEADGLTGFELDTGSEKKKEKLEVGE